MTPPPLETVLLKSPICYFRPFFWQTNQVVNENEAGSVVAKTRGFWRVVLCLEAACYTEALPYSTSFQERKLYFCFFRFEIGEGSGDNHFLFFYIQLLDKTSAQSNTLKYFHRLSCDGKAKKKRHKARVNAKLPALQVVLEVTGTETCHCCCCNWSRLGKELRTRTERRHIEMNQPSSPSRLHAW